MNKSLTISIPQYLHLQNGSNNSTENKYLLPLHELEHTACVLERAYGRAWHPGNAQE